MKKERHNTPCRRREELKEGELGRADRTLREEMLVLGGAVRPPQAPPSFLSENHLAGPSEASCERWMAKTMGVGGDKMSTPSAVPGTSGYSVHVCLMKEWMTNEWMNQSLNPTRYSIWSWGRFQNKIAPEGQTSWLRGEHGGWLMLLCWSSVLSLSWRTHEDTERNYSRENVCWIEHTRLSNSSQAKCSGQKMCVDPNDTVKGTFHRHYSFFLQVAN